MNTQQVEQIIHTFGMRKRGRGEIRILRQKYLFGRAGGDEKTAALLFIAEEYGLTMGAYQDSGCETIEEFCRMRMGSRMFGLAKSRGLL
jgi:hypothetical protein